MAQNSSSTSILIIEDEIAIAEGLVDLCELNGYSVKHVADGESGLTEALSGRETVPLSSLGDLLRSRGCCGDKFTENAVPNLRQYHYRKQGKDWFFLMNTSSSENVSLSFALPGVQTYGSYDAMKDRTALLKEEAVDIMKQLVSGTAEAHRRGIIHRDIKPSNIMIENGSNVRLMDLGIARMNGGNKFSSYGFIGTPEYSAPETFKNLFLKESDYYSFGITLYELFCGYTPYANMQPEEIEQFLSVQHIPYPEKISDRLKGFITALTYHDISNRNNKGNPNRRWTYEEVKCWTEGENLVIPGEGIGNTGSSSVPGYEFYGEVYTNPDQLVSALAENWEEGKKQLFRGNITSYFRKWNMEIARKCQAAEETAARENGKDDIIFWKLLYKINPRLKSFVWMGKSYENLAAFGREILEKLWDNDTSDFSYYSDILSEKVLSQYVQMIYPKNEKLNKVAAAIEDSYELEKNNGTDFMRTYYLMAYSLSGQKLFLLDGNQFRTVGEFAAYLRRVSEESFGKFEEICHRLVDYDGNLDIQLETWLLSLGKSDEIEKWKLSMNE